MIDREEFKSEYLQWEDGKPNRIDIVKDPVKEIQTTKDGKKYPKYILGVNRVGGGSDEVKKISLFKSDVNNMLMQADKKSGCKVESLVGCVFDYTITIVEGNWDTKISIVSCPTEVVEDST